MAEVTIDGRNHVHVRRDARDCSKEINRRLKASREQSRPSQEQISYGRGLEVERRGWTNSFYDLEVDGVEKGAD